MNELITLWARHDKTNLKINQAVWDLKNMDAVNRLNFNGYIEQTTDGVGLIWHLTGKGLQWLVDNKILEFNYSATQYNIFVRDHSNSQPMLHYFTEEFGNGDIDHFHRGDDEWIVGYSLDQLLQLLELSDCFQYKSGETAYVFNPRAIFDGDAKAGIDYIIVGGN